MKTPSLENLSGQDLMRSYSNGTEPIICAPLARVSDNIQEIQMANFNSRNGSNAPHYASGPDDMLNAIDLQTAYLHANEIRLAKNEF